MLSFCHLSLPPPPSALPFAFSQVHVGLTDLYVRCCSNFLCENYDMLSCVIPFRKYACCRMKSEREIKKKKLLFIFLTKQSAFVNFSSHHTLTPLGLLLLFFSTFFSYFMFVFLLLVLMFLQCRCIANFFQTDISTIYSFTAPVITRWWCQYDGKQ